MKHYLFSLFTLVVAFSCEKDDCEEPIVGDITEGLVAHYDFNGDANDQTTNELHGVVHGAVLTTDKDGNAESAYSFDGIDDYISVAHSDKLNLDVVSISLWANIASDQVPHEGLNDILRKWNGNTQGYPFGISYLNAAADDAVEDRILWARYDGQACDNSATGHSSPIANDTFVHLVMTKSGNTIRTYVNNVLAKDVIDPTSCSAANTADMTIGSRGNLVRFFKGTIDEIRIYNRALSAGEIGELYEQ